MVYMVCIFIVGVVGFKVLGVQEDSWLDAALMAVITFTTVGYGHETHLMSAGAKLFTIFFIIASMGFFLYVISALTGFVVEGELVRMFRRRQVRKMISKLEDHYIVCGIGRQGRVVANELHRTNRSFVMVERASDRHNELIDSFPGVPLIEGDTTDDDVLIEAGIKKAKGLVCCLSEDRDNLLLIVTAKHLNPDIRIVSRAMDIQDMVKLGRAGADSVVSPTLIGGMRMASEMIRPSVVTFLDLMLRDKDRTLRFEEIVVPADSPAIGKSLGDLDMNRRAGMVVVATWDTENERFNYAPAGDMVINEGTVLVVLGNVNNLPKVKALVM